MILLGMELSALLRRKLYDSDAESIKEHGEITEIFKNEGEAHFRDYESEAIAKLSSNTGVIIATGGGAILRDANVSALKKNGKIIFLDRHLNDLMPTADRPLASDFEALRKRYEERYPKYCAVADLTVKVSGTPRELADKIKELLNL